MLALPESSFLKDLRARDYIAEDKYACQKVLTSNYGDFFSRDHLRFFAEYLAEEKCYYIVIEHGQKIIACGGIELYGNQNLSTLVFGLVHRDYHARRVGTLLLLLRLALIDDEHESALVTLETNSEAAPFFEKFGFHQVGVRQNEYGPGKHALDYALALTRQDREHIRATVASIPLEGKGA